MNFDKLKEGFFNIFKKILRVVYKFLRWAKKWVDKVYDRLPIQDKYRRVLSMITLSVILVGIIAISVPVVKTVGETVGSAVANITGNVSSTEPVKVVAPVSAADLSSVLPDTLSTPQNDLLVIPTGSAAWRFSDSEIYRLQRMMVYLEKCNSFEYNSANKDAEMSLAAFRFLIETKSGDVVSNETKTQYSTSAFAFKKRLHNLFGKNLSQTDNLGQITDIGGYYLYNDPTPGPATVSGYITEAYSLGSNFYKITGIVTRGFPSDDGRYSKKLSVVLLKDSTADYGYYVISVVNEPISYTYLDSLPSFYFNEGYDEEDTPATTYSGTTSITIVGPGANNSSDTSSAAETITNESVAMPPITDEMKKTSLSSADEKSLLQLFDAMPDIIFNFDSASASSESNLALLSHLMLCNDAEVDFANNITVNSYEALAAKSQQVFGSALDGYMSDKVMSELHYLDPYIITGKNDYKISAVYDMGGNQYMVVCTVGYYSNPLLEKPDAQYTYTAIVEKSDAAQYKFLLKAQSFEKQ